MILPTFKKSKQKTASAPVMALDSPWWMQVRGYSCSLSNMADQSVILIREKVVARDVSLDHLTNCRVEVLLQPSTFHP